jgi:ParB-like chromosome segregation protein Spo0J
METIALDKLRLDGNTQMRVVLDQTTVYRYRDDMQDGDKFPALEATFDGKHYWLTGGFHRWHAMKLLDAKEATVIVEKGSQKDAIKKALLQNHGHGLPLTNKDKRKKVEEALAICDEKDPSDYAIAKMCHLSRSFVAAVRNPEVAEKQKAAMQRHVKKKANESKQNIDSKENEDFSDSEKRSLTTLSSPDTGATPDDEEMQATELAEVANREAMHKLLDSDDALRTAHDEIKRLNHINAQMQMRLKGLMNERNAAVDMVKKLQKKLDQLKKAD